MTGAAINAAGIVAGGIFGLAVKKTMSARYQAMAKILLGAATVWLGVRLTWQSLNGSAMQCLKGLCIVLLAMVLGKMLGRVLGLQGFSNSVGQYATKAMAGSDPARKFNDGFLVSTALFCAGPLAFLASAQEGLTGFSPLFIVKAGTDGLATMAFCATFGWSPVLSAIPVLAFEGAMIRLVQAIEPFFHRYPQPMIDSINATDGLLVFCVALLILELRKIRVAEYLPSLVIAPLLTRWLW